jgi:hypothetical protein
VFYEAGNKFSSVNYLPIFAIKKSLDFFLGKKQKHPNFQYYIIEKRKKNPGSSDLFSYY